MKIRYRFAQPSDIPEIINLMRPYNMHHIPSAEMPMLDDKYFIVAEKDGKLVGAAGFTFLSASVGKTTLMAVSPDYAGQGIGMTLQHKRMAILKGFGCERIITNADRPESIAWYKRHFGYREIGRLPKIHSFGLDDVNEWTTLEASLLDYQPAHNIQEKVVINAALTGMVPTKAVNPNVPVTPDEIVRDACRAVQLGAAILHLHARDENEIPTPDINIYRRIILGIREKYPEVIICVTTSGRNYSDFEKRSAVLRLKGDAKPDMASLTLGSMNFAHQVSVNSPQTIQGLAKMMLDEGIKPEMEVFEAGMVDYSKYLYRKGFLRMPFYYNFLLGSLGTMNGTLENLGFLVKQLPSCSVWAATGIGTSQFDVQGYALKLNGGIRVGLEDNLYLDKNKTILASNEQLILRTLDLIKQNGKEIAGLREVREWLGLSC